MRSNGSPPLLSLSEGSAFLIIPETVGPEFICMEQTGSRPEEAATANYMKLFPYLFQFLSGGNAEAKSNVTAGHAPTRHRRSARLFLIGVRSPNDQQHLVAISSCVCDEADNSPRDFGRLSES